MISTRTTDRDHRLLAHDSQSEEAQAWLARIHALLSEVDVHREQAEQERRMPARLFSDLAALGLPRMWVSRTLGGLELSMTTGLRVLLAIAQRDGSVSWQMGVQGAIGRLSDYLPLTSAREIFASHPRMVIGSVNPTGRIVQDADGGGYSLSGRWGFASGSPHAEWFVAGARLTDARGQAVLDPSGAPRVIHSFVHREQVQLHDTWFTLGLRGTASADYTIDSVRVPVERTVRGEDLLSPPPPRAERAYPVAYHDFGPFTSSATALGVARDAMATFKALAATKTPQGGTSNLARSHVVQDRLARAESDLHLAELALFHAAAAVEQHGDTGGDQLSALVRLTAATVADRAVSVVRAVNELAGTSSVYTVSRLERCFRDVHTATKHITLSPSNFEMVGQYLLGGPLALRR